MLKSVGAVVGVGVAFALFSFAGLLTAIVVGVWLWRSWSAKHLAVLAILGVVIVALLVALHRPHDANRVASAVFLCLIATISVSIPEVLKRELAEFPSCTQHHKQPRGVGRWVYSIWLWSHTDYLTTVVIATLAAQTWFERGKLLAFGDFSVGQYMAPGVAVAKSLPLWNTLWSGVGGRDFTIVQVPILTAIHAIEAVGLSGSAAERLITTALFVGQALAIVFFLREVLPGERQLARLIGGCFYLFNLLGFFLLPGLAQIAALLLIPLLSGIMLRALARGGWILAAAWAAASSGLVLVAVNPPLTVTVLFGSAAIATLIHFSRGGPLAPVLHFAEVAGPLSLLLNLWWLLPAGIAIIGSSAVRRIPVSPTVWGWTQVRNSFSNLLTLNSNWAWPQRIYFPFASAYRSPFLTVASYFPAILAFGTLTTSSGRLRRTVFALGGLSLVLIYLSKGIHSPWSATSLFLFTHVPGLWILREPSSKLLPLVATIFAVLISVSMGRAIETWTASRSTAARSEQSSAGLVVLCGLLTPLVAFPILTGSFVADRRPTLPRTHVSVPRYWSRLSSVLNAYPNQAAALMVLPPDDFYQMPYRWPYYGVDSLTSETVRRPVITGMNLGYLPMSNGATGAIARLDQAIRAGDKGRMQRGFKSLGVGFVLVRHDLDYSLVRKLGRHIPEPADYAPGLRKTGLFDYAERFGPLTLYRVRHSGQPVAAWSQFALAQAQPTGLATDARSSMQPAFLTLNPTSLERSVVSELDRNGRLMATTYQSGVGGLRYQVQSTPIKPDDLARVLGPTSSDQSSRSNLVRDGSFESIHRFRTAWGGRPGDCNNFTNEPTSQTGIRASLTTGGHRGSQALKLQARRHIGCVSQEIAVTPQSPYQLTFWHKTITGEGPRACVYSAGLNRCLTIDPVRGHRGWIKYSSKFVVPDHVRQVAVFLFALGGPSTLTTDVLDQVRVDRYNLVRGGSFESIHRFRTAWGGRAGDCNNSTNEPTSQTGIRASLTTGGQRGSQALKLQARRHIGCVSQEIAVTPQSPYQLTFWHKTITGEGPRACVYSAGLNRCLSIDPVRDSRKWSEYSTRFLVPNHVRRIAIFLYAPSGPSSPTTDLFDQVRVRDASFPIRRVVMYKPPPSRPDPKLTIEPEGPERYSVSVRNAGHPYVLTLNQTFDAGWRLSLDGDSITPHFVANGFANGWIVDKTGSYELTLEFVPEGAASIGRYLSLATLLTVAAGWLRRWVKEALDRRRHRPSGAS